MLPALTSLKRGVVLFAVCAIILPMAAGGVALDSYLKRTTLLDINSENLRLAGAIAATAASFLEAPLHTLTAVSKISSGSSLPSSTIDSLLENMVTSFGFFESIMVLDNNGIVRNIGAGRAVSLNRRDYIGTDLSGMDSIRQARSSGRHAWSNTFISSITGEPTLSLALPFATGVVVGNISLKDLSRIVAPDQKGFERAYLVNRTGRVIASRQSSRVEQQESVSTLPSVAAGLAGKRGVFRYVTHGEAVFGAVSLIPETGWLVVVERSQKEVFAHLDAMEKALLSALAGSLLLVVLLISYVSRRVIKPVEAIGLASRKLAAGDYPELPRYGGNFRELEELTSNFNEMSAALQQRESELQDRNLDLEHEIDERMRIEESLQEKNEELTAIEEELRNQLDETIHSQNELMGSQMLLSAMLDNSFQFQGLLSTDGKLIAVNRAALDFAGTPKEAVTGQYFWNTPWWNHDPELQERIRQAVSQVAAGDTVRMEVTHRDVAGELRVIDFSMKPAIDAKGSVTFLIPEGHDITDQRLLEQQVAQQQKLEGIGLLAGGIAHDFNNLLTPIFGYADLIRKKFTPEDQLYARASAILDAAAKAKELVQQLLSFSRKQVLTTRPYDLNEIAGSFLTIMRRTIRENIEISQELCPEPCHVLVDRTRIEQILLNLAVNAQDAIGGNGRISIETGHLMLDDEYCRLHPGALPGRFIVLVFSDSGSGMDDATLSHIFEPFFTTKQAGHGTGLGLSTVYGIVKQHGGYIDARSMPGHGTTFRIYLPALESGISVETPSSDQQARCEHSGQTILLVEDNQMVMEMVRDLLTSFGYSVLAAASADEAIAMTLANSAAISLLVTDVVMPQMNGPELHERLQEFIPELKVLFMSGYANNVTVYKGALEEGVNFIAKPFTSEEFARRVSEMLGSHG